MEFYIICLIFISCMIALALLIYYCQEKRDPKYGINENQRAITSIALSVGLPEFLNQDDKNPNLKNPAASNQNAVVYLEDSDSDSSEKMYYPRKSVAYSVARRMSLKAPPSRQVSITPIEAIQAIEYLNKRRMSLPARPQIDTENQISSSTLQGRILPARLSEEKEAISSASSSENLREPESQQLTSKRKFSHDSSPIPVGDLMELARQQLVLGRKFNRELTPIDDFSESSDKSLNELRELQLQQMASQRKFSRELTFEDTFTISNKTRNDLKEIQRQQLAWKRKMSQDFNSMEDINEGVLADFSELTRKNLRELQENELGSKRKCSEDLTSIRRILAKRTSV